MSDNRIGFPLKSGVKQIAFCISEALGFWYMEHYGTNFRACRILHGKMCAAVLRYNVSELPLKGVVL